jgi:P27 family predicted phage terminase small subunit
MNGALGRSGRKPKLTALKLIEGNPGKRKLHADLVGVGAPIMPPHLSELELFFWHATIAAIPPGVLSAADSAILERFVTAWARFRECQQQLARTGLLVRGMSGPIRNPLLAVQRQASAEMHAAGAELGLSPVSRTRLGNPAADKNDDFEWLLGDNPDLPN